MGMYYGYNNNYSCTTTTEQTVSKKVSEDTFSTKTKVPQSPQVKERTGCINRNDIGFLIWDRDESRTARWQLGSRLKTPTLPMWVTKVNDNYGVLFNPNKELMRSYAAENRSDFYQWVLPFTYLAFKLILRFFVCITDFSCITFPMLNSRKKNAKILCWPLIRVTQKPGLSTRPTTLMMQI